MYSFARWGALAALAGSISVFAQGPAITGVANAGSLDSRLAPGVVALIYGSGFTAVTTVTVGGEPGYIIAVQPSAMTIEFPTDLQPGTAEIVVASGGAASNAFTVAVNLLAPAFYARNGSVFVRQSDQSAVSASAPAHPGEAITAYMVGLGATNPPVPAGITSILAPVAANTTMFLAGAPLTVSSAILTPGAAGVYQVNFTVPQDAPAGDDPILFSVGGVSANIVNLPVGAGPTVSRIVNAGSFTSDGTAAPGSIVTLYGTGFGATDNLSAFPATESSGTSVLFNGQPAPLFAVAASLGQINVLVPPDLPDSGQAQVVVQTALGASQPYTLNLSPSVPGIFSISDPINGKRRNAAAVLASTKWIAMPLSMGSALDLPIDCTDLSPLSYCAHPAKPGDYIEIYITGLGKATPGGDPGGAPLTAADVAPVSGDPLYKTVATPQVTIGGQDAPPLFSGVTPGFTGLYQIDVQVPTGTPDGNDIPVVIGMPNGASDTATIAVHR